MKLTQNLVLANLTLVLATAISAATAHATTITYNLIGASAPNGSLTGTVTIDTATDLITAADITFNDSAVGDPVFTNIGSPNAYNGLGQDYISGPSNGPLNYGGQIALYYDTANIGTGNLGICFAVGPCGTGSNEASTVQAYVSSNNGGPFDLTSGSLDPVTAAVPEPSSLVLLGTGLVGIAGTIALMQGRSRKA